MCHIVVCPIVCLPTVCHIVCLPTVCHVVCLPTVCHIVCLSTVYHIVCLPTVCHIVCLPTCTDKHVFILAMILVLSLIVSKICTCYSVQAMLLHNAPFPLRRRAWPDTLMGSVTK